MDKENNIKLLYKQVIEKGFYDEQYGMKPQIIEGKMHGVCIDFSQELKNSFLENGFLAGIISTLNSDGFMHAAVVYKNVETGEIKIADPVTDVKKLTGLSDEERAQEIQEILSRSNWERNLKDYLTEFGTITAYDENLQPSLTDIQDIEEIEAIPSINTEFEKKVVSKAVTKISHLKEVADGPVLLACQTLYKKGIDTFCSNYAPGESVSINVDFSSLSKENKKIILELYRKSPSNYTIKRRTGLYGHLDSPGPNIENYFDENIPLELIFGYQDSEVNSEATPIINIKMNDLISALKKQTFMYGVFTRDDILNNKHNKMDRGVPLLHELQPLKSSINDSNEDIASNEGLIYSKKYDMFFTDYVSKSRYIESLYRGEHDLRSEEEIAHDSGVIYEPSNEMFFESERDLEYYRNTLIGPKEIAEMSITRKPRKNIIQNIKDLFSKLRNKITNREDR